jgi:hypothetical protein
MDSILLHSAILSALIRIYHLPREPCIVVRSRARFLRNLDDFLEEYEQGERRVNEGLMTWSLTWGTVEKFVSEFE